MLNDLEESFHEKENDSLNFYLFNNYFWNVASIFYCC